jgi:ABC-type transporter Mla subunit MlaD
MFKRLFFLSFVIAFLLACFAMWFWYLPGQEIDSVPKTETETAVFEADTITDSLPE